MQPPSVAATETTSLTSDKDAEALAYCISFDQIIFSIFLTPSNLNNKIMIK
jgi:hypothetical protein